MSRSVPAGSWWHVLVPVRRGLPPSVQADQEGMDYHRYEYLDTVSAAGAGPGPGQHRQPARGEALDGPQAHPIRLGHVRPRHRRGHRH